MCFFFVVGDLEGAESLHVYASGVWVDSRGSCHFLVASDIEERRPFRCISHKGVVVS